MYSKNNHTTESKYKRSKQIFQKKRTQFHAMWNDCKQLKIRSVFTNTALVTSRLNSGKRSLSFGSECLAFPSPVEKPTV